MIGETHRASIRHVCFIGAMMAVCKSGEILVSSRVDASHPQHSIFKEVYDYIKETIAPEEMSEG